jgi:hypothetical protein
MGGQPRNRLKSNSNQGQERKVRRDRETVSGWSFVSLLLLQDRSKGQFKLIVNLIRMKWMKVISAHKNMMHQEPQQL